MEQEVQPEIERLNLFTRGTLQISPSLTAYTELGYFNTKTKANGTLGANNDGGVFVPGGSCSIRCSFTDSMILPAAHPDNTFGVDRDLRLSPERTRRARPDDRQPGLPGLVRACRAATSAGTATSALLYVEEQAEEHRTSASSTTT